jgi:hypothetical protein
VPLIPVLASDTAAAATVRAAANHIGDNDYLPAAINGGGTYQTRCSKEQFFLEDDLQLAGSEVTSAGRFSRLRLILRD